MTSRDYFKGKRVAVVGMGACGEMVEDVKFLIKAGALVSIYDLKSEARLKGNLVFLRSIGLANFVCSSIPADDLLDMDLIVLSHEYSRDSHFLREVNAHNELASKSPKDENGLIQNYTEKKSKIIPIEYPETLFFKHAPPVTVIGVIGTCGKSTVISMLAPMLERACADIDGQGFFVLDSESEDGIIARLKKVKSGDIILMKINDPMMAELHAIRISPHVAVCTSIPPNSPFANSLFELLAYQTYNNFIVASDEVIDTTHALNVQPKAKMLRTKSSLIPAEWLLYGKGAHDKENAALALQTARLFKVSDDVAENVLKEWKSLKGHLELVKTVKNVEFYNDTASISPYTTKTAIKAIGGGKNVVLIYGGAKGNGDYGDLYAILPDYVHSIILLPGSGTMHERNTLSQLEGVEIFSAQSIDEAVVLAFEHAKRGDKILFSPGFEALGIDGARKDRGERFVKAVRSI